MRLSVEGITKSYRRGSVVLNELNLNLEPGVAGLLGPNGAGKTTLMKILATVLRPSTGAVLWKGVNVVDQPQSLRRTLGYLPQSFGIYPHLTAVDFLRYMASVKLLVGRAAHSRIEELLSVLNLADVKDRPLSQYSGGMRQRLGIAVALLNDPEVLILDEPTVGLDPQERAQLRNLISDLSASKIVLYSTHVVSDLEAVASQIVVLKEGRLCRAAPPQELLEELTGKVWEGQLANDETARLRADWLVSSLVRNKHESRLRVISATRPWSTAAATAPSLEDVYLSITSVHQ